MPLITKINAFFNPEQFQGWGKKKNYFEGWYFKIVSSDSSKALAIIPGIAMDEMGNQQAFIQVLDGKMNTAAYHKFDINTFKPQPGKFEIEISGNLFSEKILQIEVPGVQGKLHFSGNVNWPKPWYSPGIMGPFAFVPFMECYHGIVSMDHVIQGKLALNGEIADFSNGRGYIEKDWGRSFPSAYFWMQSNHFNEAGISLKCSVAKIPWLRSSFVGFIAGMWIDNRLISFTTYNQSKLRKSFASEKEVEVVLENKNYLLEILACRDKATALASPVHGFMNGRIEESMTSSIAVMLTDKKNNKIIISDTGINAGLEVAGRVEEIML